MIINLSLIFIALYLILGNIPRFYTPAGFDSSILVSEFLIYAIVLTCGLFKNYLFDSLKKCIFIILVTFLSYCVGIVKFGWQGQATVYAVRFILLLLSGVVAGRILFEKYGRDYIKTAKYFLTTYFFLVVFGFIIFFVFPNSSELWEFLKQFNIDFLGDPHENRFLSTYFDPNYYSAIGIIPAILSVLVYRRSKSGLYLILFCLFSSTILLSGSRSGIVSAVILLSLTLLKSFLSNISFKFSNKTFFQLFLLLFALLVLSPLIFYYSSKIIDRLLIIGDDTSAFARVVSFQFGLTLFSENPILGIGFNYLASFAVQFNELTSLDSSLLSILVNYGLIFTFTLSIYFLLKINQLLQRLEPYLKSDIFLKDFVWSFIIYIFIIILFTSQFNNLLFYQFWLFPVLMLLSYLDVFSLKKNEK